MPRTCLFGGKAAPGYQRAKLIIRLINGIAEIINRDPAVNELLRVVFLPNYGVSLAEKLIPAADLSEQIATAGKEASGTSNMKFALNGALTIGTLDGANVEIRDEVGTENIFIFGRMRMKCCACARDGYRPVRLPRRLSAAAAGAAPARLRFLLPRRTGPLPPTLRRPGEPRRLFPAGGFRPLLASQELVSHAFRDTARWTKMSILNVARCGKFSSDRAIAEYARDIWHVTSMPPETACALPRRRRNWRWAGGDPSLAGKRRRAGSGY